MRGRFEPLACEPERTDLMKTTKLIAAIALLTGTTAVYCENYPAQTPQNVVQLSASGSVEVQQDLLAISMSTTRDGPDAATVQAQLKLALDAALGEAKKAALPGQLDVRTGNFTLYPRYGRDGKINGWQGSTELVLEGRDFARISTTAGKVQTLTLANVSFGLSREQRAKEEGDAQAVAIDRFKARRARSPGASVFPAMPCARCQSTPTTRALLPAPACWP